MSTASEHSVTIEEDEKSNPPSDVEEADDAGDAGDDDNEENEEKENKKMKMPKKPKGMKGLKKLKFGNNKVAPKAPKMPAPPKSPAKKPAIQPRKKTMVQGMIDVALLSSNIGHLREVMDLGEAHKYYEVSVYLLTGSISLQMLIGIGIAMLPPIKFFENLLSTMIYIVLFLNLFITAFALIRK